MAAFFGRSADANKYGEVTHDVGAGVRVAQEVAVLDLKLLLREAQVGVRPVHLGCAGVAPE
eukprot:14013134-Alexandrium_andersonii.AAC.1